MLLKSSTNLSNQMKGHKPELPYVESNYREALRSLQLVNPEGSVNMATLLKKLSINNCGKLTPESLLNTYR